jgi:hypothetical protein
VSAFGLMISPALVVNTVGSSAPRPGTRMIRAVSGSTTSTEAMAASAGATVLSSRPLFRSRLALTAVASTGVPSWKLTPSRSVSSRYEPSGANCQDVASIGSTSRSLLSRVSRS